MKAETYTLRKSNPINRQAVITSVVRKANELELDKDFDIIIKNHDSSKSAKQRRLSWLWCREVADSGIGRGKSAEGVHLDAKWMFARPLIFAGDDKYSMWITDLYNMIIEKYPNDNDRLKSFFELSVHTQQMEVSMVANMLKDFQNYWTSKSVNLTDPSLMGLKEL